MMRRLGAALLLLLVLAHTALAVPALVGSVTHSARQQWDNLFPITIQSTTAGSALVLITAWYEATGKGVTGVTGCGTWTAATSRNGDANSHIQIWFAPDVSGGCTTVTLATNVSGGNNIDGEADVLEFSGMATASLLDIDVTGTGSDATMETVSGTLAQAEEVLFNIGSHTGADATLTHDIVGGYTLISQNNDNDTGQTYLSQYKIVAVTTPDTADIGLTASRAWYTSGVGLKGAGGGAAPAPKRSTLIGVGP